VQAAGARGNRNVPAAAAMDAALDLLQLPASIPCLETKYPQYARVNPNTSIEPNCA
jgi:hypothetical protein